MTQEQAGEWTTLEERVMATCPRGRSDELRMLFVRKRTPDGKELAWHELRMFCLDSQNRWVRGKQGITIRGKEMATIAKAFATATSGGKP